MLRAEVTAMSRVKNKRKQYELDEAKIKRLQRLLGAPSEAEALELAVDEVITERERNRLAWRAHEQFLKGGGEIRDVYGLLE
jgi:hypothetical protein